MNQIHWRLCKIWNCKNNCIKLLYKFPLSLWPCPYIFGPRSHVLGWGWYQKTYITMPIYQRLHKNRKRKTLTKTWTLTFSTSRSCMGSGMVPQNVLETYLSSYQTWFQFITVFGNNEFIFGQTHLDIERNSCIRFRQNSSSRCENGENQIWPLAAIFVDGPEPFSGVHNYTTRGTSQASFEKSDQWSRRCDNEKRFTDIRTYGRLDVLARLIQAS